MSERETIYALGLEKKRAAAEILANYQDTLDARIAVAGTAGRVILDNEVEIVA